MLPFPALAHVLGTHAPDSQYTASLYHSHTIIHMLDDLEGSIDAGGFGDGVYEGNEKSAADSNQRRSPVSDIFLLMRLAGIRFLR